jgi:hypothetical protein
MKITVAWGMVAHVCNLSTQEAEAGWLQVPGQPGLQSEILSQKRKEEKERNKD